MGNITACVQARLEIVTPEPREPSALAVHDVMMSVSEVHDMMTPVSEVHDIHRVLDSKPDNDPAVIKLAFKLLERMSTELNHADCQRRLKEHVIDPLIRMLYLQLSPYVMVVCAVVLIILLTSLCTCTMTLFLFRSRR
jgi:hypothetical protein